MKVKDTPVRPSPFIVIVGNPRHSQLTISLTLNIYNYGRKQRNKS